MRHFLASLAVVLLAQGCAFEDGNPWGRADFHLSAAFDPPTSRIQDGAFRTAKDYLIDFDEVAIEFGAVELEVSTSGEVGSFDPANPPDGYSLCHNGHCHAADGSLVDYDDIAVEQAGGDSLTVLAIDQSVVLTAEPTSLDLGDCESCNLERGELGLVRLRIRSLHITGTVTDIRDRLAEPVTLDEDLAIGVAIATAVAGEISPGKPGLAIVDLSFELAPNFLDGVDFAEGPVTPESVQISDALDVDVEMQEL